MSQEIVSSAAMWCLLCSPGERLRPCTTWKTKRLLAAYTMMGTPP